MANYYGYHKTNDFRVNDEQAYERLMKGMSCEDCREFCPVASQSPIVIHYEVNGLPLYDEKHNPVDLSNKDELDKHVRLYSQYGEEIFTCVDKDGHRIHSFGGFSSADWYPFAADDEDIKARMAKNEPFFTISGESIPYSDLDNHDEIYDADGNCLWSKYENDSDFDEFLNRMQSLLYENDVFVYQEIGHEGLKYLCGMAIIVTKTDIKQMSLSQWIEQTQKGLTL